MAIFETDFEVIKNEKGEVQGFSLIAQPQTEAEVFCATFPKALLNKKADILFEKEKIIFDHPTCGFPGKDTHKVDEVECIALQKLLIDDRKIKLEKAGFFTPGFKIVLA